MRRLRWFVARLTALFTPRSRDRELDEEIAFHLEEDAAEGEGGPDARHRARLGFGNVARVKEAAREVWTWGAVERLTQDVRHAVRVLRRRPVFTATAVLSLALGIGSTAAVFDLLKAMHLDRLPVSQAGELVQVSGERGAGSTYSTFDRLRRASRTLDGLTGSEQAGAIDLEENGERTQAYVEFVTENYFDVLDVRAQRGRAFHSRSPGAPREMLAVISDEYWRSHYRGDLSMLGAARFRLLASGLEFTVVGIAPPGFRGVHLDAPADIWVSLEATSVAGDDLEEWRPRLLGRLAAGETTDRAAAEATAILGRPMRVVSGAHGYSDLRGRLTPPLLLLGLVVLGVLLITYGNLANLVLAATASRERELAVRRAIGASRRRIVRQLATESVVLSSLAAALGLAVAYSTSAALLSFLPPNQVQALRNLRFEPGPVVIGVIAVLALFTSVACGVLPALRATRTGSPHALRARQGSTAESRNWTSRGLIAGEVAMCTLLLVLAGVFVRSLHNLLSQETGYVAEGLVTADLRFPPRQYTEIRRDQLYEALRARLNTLPGVTAASYSHLGQLRGATFDYVVRIPGRPDDGEPQTANEVRAAPGFLAAMGTILRSGRDLADTDRVDGPRVALVNEAFVRTFDLGAHAIGRRFEAGDGSRAIRSLEIIGIVENSKWLTLREADRPMYYVPYQQSAGRPIVRFAVRGTGSPDFLVRSIVSTAAAVNPDMILTNVVPFSEVVDRTLVIERLVAHVSTAFAIVGVLVACLGLYGVLAYAVVRRRREIGVRIAVGASPGVVEWMMLRESFALLAIGLAAGVPVAVAATRLASSLLFGLRPGDPATIAVTLVILALATAAASFVPARRASRVDPVTALREE
jgi:predicted permease